jgi:hypothetical protein
VCLTAVLGVAEVQPQVVHVLQDLFQSQLGQFTAGATQTGGNTQAIKHSSEQEHYCDQALT